MAKSRRGPAAGIENGQQHAVEVGDCDGSEEWVSVVVWSGMLRETERNKRMNVAMGSDIEKRLTCDLLWDGCGRSIGGRSNKAGELSRAID